MEALRDHLRNSLATSLLTGLALATLIPLGMVPFTKFLKRHKRSINQRLQYSGKKKPDDFNFVVTRTITLTGTATGVYLYLAAKSDNVLWSVADATPLFLLKTFASCVILRDFIQYGVHRILHSKLLYQRFHAKHHAIRHVHDDYDGYYINFMDTFLAAVTAYIPPLFLMSKVHVFAVIFYIVFVAFFVFSVNHCGREVLIAIPIPLVTRKLVIYHSQHHDDHHVYGHGNYGELLPFFDYLFGSTLVIKNRPPLPARRLWRKAQKVLTLIRVVNAIKSAKEKQL
jgi:sterol desaturase/sphingolipid hydroxylase (fatty acid hydroxylase superfamily)